MTTLIIAIILTLAYNAALIIKNRSIPPSLSDSFYIFGGKSGFGYIFYGYLVAMIFLLIVPMIEATPEQWKFLPFLALASLGFTGTAADFIAEKKVHTVSAIISAILALAWCSIVGCWDVVLWSMGVATVIACISFKNRIYWLEMGCFASVFITLSFIIFNS
jgi:hypothetical protein